jgi:hypothetical protein
LPFFDEVLNIIIGYEAYLILDGYSGYHQIFMTLEDRYKTNFVIDWGIFVWMEMPFGVKNGPLTFERVIKNVFRVLRSIHEDIFG